MMPMKLLKVSFDHLSMFENGTFNLDLYASDKVYAQDESVFELERPIYSNDVVALAGVNASGKTTGLKLIELACLILNGSPVDRDRVSSYESLFTGSSLFRSLLWHRGALYLVESRLDFDEGPDYARTHFSFKDESISKLSTAAIRKSTLSSWERLLGAAKPLGRRTELPESWLSMLASDVSVANALIARDSGAKPKVVVVRDEGFRLDAGFKGLDEVLRVFDSSIRHLEIGDMGRVFTLTFEGQRPMSLSTEGLIEVLSSGTVRGLALVQRAMVALKSGGYLLVDEIENHLNRQLVNVLIDLFTSKETNPKGACVIFTTHYPQLLDHVHRKDNVYFLVRPRGTGAEVVKYGEKVKRIENKKSEVFSSNYVKGTAPRYADVRALKALVAKGVSGE